MPADLTIAVPSSGRSKGGRLVVITGSLLSWTAVRSSGPGGQNVNKVSSKVDLRFDVDACDVLDAGQKARLRAAAKLDASGRVMIVSQVTRNRVRNLQDARARLATMIAAAWLAPRPRKRRKKPRGVNEKRLRDKRHKSEKKRSRQQVDR